MRGGIESAREARGVTPGTRTGAGLCLAGQVGHVDFPLGRVGLRGRVGEVVLDTAAPGLALGGVRDVECDAALFRPLMQRGVGGEQAVVWSGVPEYRVTACREDARLNASLPVTGELTGTPSTSCRPAIMSMTR